MYKNRKPETEPNIWKIFALEVLSQLDLKDKYVLDVGVGFGYILRRLKSRNIVPYAIELSNQCMAYLKVHGIDAEKIDISIECFPYEDNFFDYVIFTEVMEHLAFPQHALKEIYRVLRPGGKLLVSTHNAFNLYMRLKYLIGAIPTVDLDVSREGQHLRLYNYAVLLDLLTNAGFKRIINKSWFKLGRIRFYVPNFLTSLISRYFFLICIK